MAENHIPYPFRGLDENGPFGEQPYTTTRDCQNVRSSDPVTDRIRGGQRSGLSAYVDQQLKGNDPIKDLNYTVVDDKRLDYADQAAAQDWLTAVTSANLGFSQLVTSSVGDVYALATNKNVVHVFSSHGKALFTIPVDISGLTNQNYCSVMAIDEFDELFIGNSENPTAGQPTLFHYRRDSATSYEKLWDIELKPNSNPVRCMQIAVKNDRLYAIIYDPTAAESYLFVFDNIYEPTPPSPPTLQITLGTNAIGQGVAVNDSGDMFACYRTTAPDQWLEKFTPAGNSVWKKQAGAPGSDGGGLGIAVATRGDLVWSMGFGHSGDNRWLVQWSDAGGSASQDWVVTTDGASASVQNYLRIVPDAFDNIHVPFPASATGTWDEYQIRDTATGALELGHDTTSSEVSSITLPPTNPDYVGSIAPPTRPEFAYICEQGLGALERLRLVSVTTQSGSARTIKKVAAVGGQFREFDAPSTNTFTGGTYSTLLEWIMSTAYSGEIFYTDGKDYYVYSAVDGTVAPWEAEGSGEIPPRCKLLTNWNGRIVLSRNPDDAHNIFFSEHGNPYGWDFFPYTPNVKQAVATNTSESLGRVPDIVNALVPYSDELLIIGCDHSLHILVGDPAVQGYIDLLSDSTGMAFGRSWAKDERGVLYFFGSRGGVFYMMPGGLPRRLSSSDDPNEYLPSIERRLNSVDLTTHAVQLVWNTQDRGLHVLVEPYSTAAVVTVPASEAAVVESYFWERRTGSWSPDRYEPAPVAVGGVSGFSRQPHSAIVIDGDDPSDRVLLFGCEDGVVRAWDESATDDDGSPIDSFVTIGPMVPASELGAEFKFRSLTPVMATGQGSVNYEVFVNDRPDVLPPSPQRLGVLQPGRNRTIRLRERGSAAWLRLRDATAANRWALESLVLGYAVGGRVRQRG